MAPSPHKQACTGMLSENSKNHAHNLMSLAPIGISVVKADIDNLLKKVHDDDKVLVGNVIRTMQVLRTHDFVHNFEVVCNQKGYDVIGTLSKSFERELIVTEADFEVIQSVNPTRVSTVMVQESNNHSTYLKI
jgi:hypothetical protein